MVKYPRDGYSIYNLHPSRHDNRFKEGFGYCSQTFFILIENL